MVRDVAIAALLDQVARVDHRVDRAAVVELHRGFVEIGRLVRELTGRDPRMVKLLSTDAGRVVFLTLDMGAGESLTRAHALAGRLEEELRRRIEGIAEVVVHTEP